MRRLALSVAYGLVVMAVWWAGRLVWPTVHPTDLGVVFIIASTSYWAGRGPEGRP